MILVNDFLLWKVHQRVPGGQMNRCFMESNLCFKSREYF